MKAGFPADGVPSKLRERCLGHLIILIRDGRNNLACQTLGAHFSHHMPDQVTKFRATPSKLQILTLSDFVCVERQNLIKKMMVGIPICISHVS